MNSINQILATRAVPPPGLYRFLDDRLALDRRIAASGVMEPYLRLQRALAPVAEHFNRLERMLPPAGQLRALGAIMGNSHAE